MHYNNEDQFVLTSEIENLSHIYTIETNLIL